jgi:hypothetical protein
MYRVISLQVFLKNEDMVITKEKEKKGMPRSMTQKRKKQKKEKG